jgi:hypothetical protein
MKKRNLLTLSVLCALSLNAAASTSLIVKPIGDHSGGVDIGGGYKRITIDSQLSDQDLLNSLIESGKFKSVELDVKISRPIVQPKTAVQPISEPQSGNEKSNNNVQNTNAIDDPYFSLQKYLHSSDSFINGTNLQDATDYLRDLKGNDGKTVRVLVVDGSFYENSEIPYAEGYSFATRNDGLESRPNFFASEPGGACSVEHGTAVSSIYGAIRDNGTSIAGAADNVRIIAAEALVCNEGRIADVVKSMYWGMGESVGNTPNISEPVDIINLSLGVESDTCPPSFQDAINLATERGIQVHISAGNSSIDAKGFTPSNCDNAFVTGGLAMHVDTVAGFSNRGDTVNVYAQGMDLLTLDSVEGSVSNMDGTSFSVALTGSTGALLKSHYPDATPEQIYWFIESGTRILSDQAACKTSPCEKGQVDALAASKRAEEYFSQETTTIKPALAAGESCLSGYVGKYFTETSGLCGLFEVSFESQTDKSGITYQLHATPISGGESFVVTETSEASIMLRDIDLQNFHYNYSVCTNGECTESPLDFAIDTTTPQECQ